jgi:hypothetical protein
LTDKVWTLEVQHSEFLNAFRRTISTATKRTLQPPALFTFSDGKLNVEALGVAAQIPASGEWPGVVAVPANLLGQLVEKHVADGLSPFTDAEKAVIKHIAQAWAVLAPLGVEPNEIKALVDDSIKNAWKR